MAEPNPQLVCVTGLPRAGSTLLCQLLAHHPDIRCSGMTSPLVQMLLGLREQMGQNDFLLAQLDQEATATHQRLIETYRGLARGWLGEGDESVVVDKNRGWLPALDFAAALRPEVKMLVCVRDLGQILASIEAAHERTIGLDFADKTGSLSPYDRANRLLAKDGVVGLPLHAFRNAQDFPAELQKRLFFVVFEDLVKDPARMLEEVWRFLEVPAVRLNFDQLKLLPRESDSHYRLKYTHETHAGMKPPRMREVPPRIEAELRHSFGWYYRIFYPGAGA